jgi:KDO2-lipid IV(A) lauroyltransferase
MSVSAKQRAVEGTPLTQFLGPRYWRLWLMLGLARLVSMMPIRLQLWLGRRLGRLALPFSRRRGEIARRNLAACFPGLDVRAREALLRQHFAHLGETVFETTTCWWSTDQRLRPRTTVKGLTHLEEALARGKGAILLTAHFTTLEMGARLIAMYTPLHVVYRRHENPLLQEMLRRTRGAHAEKIIPRTEVRTLIRSLRSNRALWFAPDQAPRGPHDSVVAPFFGVPALSNTATARLARMTGAAVLPYYPRRDDRGRYELVIGPPLEDFPSGDAVADATRVNEVFEQEIRRAPARYLWIHRRFKSRRREEPDLYSDLGR